MVLAVGREAEEAAALGPVVSDGSSQLKQNMNIFQGIVSQTCMLLVNSWYVLLSSINWASGAVAAPGACESTDEVISVGKSVDKSC